MTTQMSAMDVRRQIDHPVIDGDGHLTELAPAGYPFLREHLSAEQFEEFLRWGTPTARGMRFRPAAEQRRTGSPQIAWWGGPTRHAIDKATPMLPALLYERLPEIGFDYGIFYTSAAMGFLAVADEDQRRGLSAGWNDFLADLSGPFADRMTFAGLVPMHTPEEALAELRHCKELGLKVVALPEGVLRPIPEPDPADAASPFLWPGQTHWFDTFGWDSAYDYDPVWSAAREMKLAVTFHGGMGLRPGLWTFTNNYCANHIGAFAQNMFPLCKSLYLGGVTRRFPQMPFAFLECGVSWGSQLLADIVEHWHKRGIHALPELDPANLDAEAVADYLAKFGGRVSELMGNPDPLELALAMKEPGLPQAELYDDFARLGASNEEDLVRLFTDSFYFGCEADDRGVAVAFSAVNPGGKALRAIFSSDIGHWDVPDISAVLPESYEMVTENLLTPEQYRAFMFDNAFELCTRADPEFFAGTSIEPHVAAGRGQRLPA
jgi:predicted TIM-barrel fold metal-dependent hydrolase